ncbi:C2H2 finger domain protein, partial [Aspergillus sclerotialis]
MPSRKVRPTNGKPHNQTSILPNILQILPISLYRSQHKKPTQNIHLQFLTLWLRELLRFKKRMETPRPIPTPPTRLLRCDLGSCNANVSSPKSKPSRNGVDTSRVANDFNRKDLFTQHQRRMHAPWMVRGDKRQPSEEEKDIFERSLEDVRARCWVEQRKPPGRSQCGFCGRVFCGPTSWDERMEHVGRHFEKDEFLSEEVEDMDLR